MKIAIFTPSFLPKVSGAEIFHHNLATRLVASGHQVMVVLPRKSAAAIRSQGWRLNYQLTPFPSNVWSYFRRWPWVAYRLAGWHLGRLQAKYQFDLWHGVMMYPTGVALIDWANSRGIPYLVRSAGDDVIAALDGSVGMRLDPRVNELIRQQVPQAECLIALSESIRSEFRSLGVEEQKIRVIPNAVDLPRFQQSLDCRQVRESFGLKPEGFLFLAVGRNHAQKNYPALLKAASKLKQEGLDFQILVAGRNAGELEADAAALGLAGCFYGREVGAAEGQDLQLPPRQLIDLYRSADAFVMPSVLEGFSSALLEAMAAGLPVVTTDAPGCRDFIRDGEDAMMVPAGDAGALAGAMRELLTSPEKAENLRKKSLARAAMFDWPVVVGMYEALYRELVEARRKTKS